MEVAKPKALIVRSDGHSLSDYADYLARIGWSYRDVKFESDGWLKSASSEYDLLIAGLPLPQLDIVRLIEQLKTANPWQTILLVKGSEQSVDVPEVIKAGAADVLEPEIDTDRFQTTLHRVLREGSLADRHGDRFITSAKTTYEVTSEELVVSELTPRILDGLVRAGRLDAKSCAQIKICFQEALTNSLDHGNLELDSAWKEELNSEGLDRYEQVRRDRLKDPHYCKRMLFITVEFDGSNLSFTIKDQGSGFDFSKKRNEIVSNEANHGRGLYLMDRIMDEVKFAKGGTEVTFSKILGTK